MIMKTITGLLAGFFISASANALLIDFEPPFPPDPVFTGSGVSLYSRACCPTGSGYINVLDATSSDFGLFNPSGASPSDLFWNSAGTFDLNSFIIAGAWGNQTLTIEGYVLGSLLYSTDLAISLSPVTATFDWTGIDQLRIITGSGTIPSIPNLGSGWHWALDNMIINEAVSVPEPGSLALLGVGLLGVLLARRKQI